MNSLRLRLLISMLGLFLAGWLAVAWFTFDQARHEVEELFDAQLAQTARMILGIASQQVEEGELAGIHLNAFLEGHSYEKKVSFQIWQRDRLLLHTASAPNAPLSEQAGFADRHVQGALWRVFNLHHPQQELSIQVGESYDVRNELVEEISEQVLLPLLAALPLLALLFWPLVNGALKPLRRLTGEMEARTPQDLHPVEANDAPEEIRPLVHALNGLLTRLERALTNERRFTADAAHELRTPLASLKVQAQVALRSREEEERTQALNQILSGVDRATRLVEQLLTLARLDPEIDREEGERCALKPLAETVLAELAPAAVAKEIDLTLEAAEEVEAFCRPSAIAILLRNLADNAIRYAPNQGRTKVSIHRENGRAVLRIEDSGPGIPPEMRKNLLQRFRRGPAKDAHGCGLGLSIVERIVELHRAELTMWDSDLGGLAVSITFPETTS